ncbi:MAG: S1 RNA-binding domain-containing protein [Chloroflexota bacterium]
MDQNDAAKNDEEVANDEGLENISMESLLEQSELSLNMPRSGEIREGMIASVSNDEILVSIGAKSEGIIPSRELAQLNEDARAKLKVGETVKVFIISPESRQGNLILSLTRAMEEDDWAKAEEFLKSKEIHEGKVEGFNKGGLIVEMGYLRGFVPASQVSLSRRIGNTGHTPDQRTSRKIDQPKKVRDIEEDRERRRLIMSEKAAAQESRETLKDRLLEELVEGTTRKGRVTSLADFGAFVNINGADGLVHLSEISWDRIEHPSEVLKVGQEIEVKIISIDRERRRIGLSIRRLKNDPWEIYTEAYQIGQLIEGTITRLTKFGAFARIDENLEGLIHVSELSDKRIEHPKEVVSDGDVITLRVIKIDNERRRLGLSLRKVESMEYSDMDWEMTLAEIDADGIEDAEESIEEEQTEEAATEEAVLVTDEETSEDAPEADGEAEAAEDSDQTEPEPEEPPAEEEKPEPDSEAAPVTDEESSEADAAEDADEGDQEKE